ncbi:Zinc finger protein 311 [Frankliniella fusca]|uniref:Zinc finger protein 311 n=1 Tax=Frankliniella fusca TaxID=407009 RepID=A0AAE1H7Z7_9NEOP|nr:Zinc finger protein 311 [Frankliniella fusca]
MVVYILCNASIWILTQRGSIVAGFPCRECEKTFPSKYARRKHEQVSHMGRLMHEYPLELMESLALEGLGPARKPRRCSSRPAPAEVDRPHKCSTCPAAFFKPSALRDHMLVHTGERPFLCDLCGTSFTQKSKRKKHLFIRHGLVS